METLGKTGNKINECHTSSRPPMWIHNIVRSISITPCSVCDHCRERSFDELRVEFSPISLAHTDDTHELHWINDWARSGSEQVTLESRLIIEFERERERERERMQGKKIANFAIETLSRRLSPAGRSLTIAEMNHDNGNCAAICQLTSNRK